MKERGGGEGVDLKVFFFESYPRDRVNFACGRQWEGKALESKIKIDQSSSS